MSFGQPSGPPATAKQVQQLLALLNEAGHTDFRDARGPMGFNQRQAAGKFTRSEVEALIDEPGVRMVVEQLGGGGPFDRKVYPRPQILASLPNAGPWVLPNGWHVDAPRLASGNSPGLQMFACLDDVAPRGGATLAVAGSHHLLNDGRHLKARGINATLRQEPFFQRLFYGPADADLPADEVGARLAAAIATFAERRAQPL